MEKGEDCIMWKNTIQKKKHHVNLPAEMKAEDAVRIVLSSLYWDGWTLIKSLLINRKYWDGWALIKSLLINKKYWAGLDTY